MGVYADQVLPRIINVACGLKPLRPYRTRVCEGLHGRVVEVGSVAAVEPADAGWKLAGKRVAGSEVTVERTGLDGQSLPLPDASCDAALSTFTLCTIPDAGAALAEIRRVLKPGGTFHFLEHGLAPDEKVRRWQHRLEPMQKRIFGGCHLTRPIADLVTGAGFEITDIDVFYEKAAPKFVAAYSLGTAVVPSG